MRLQPTFLSRQQVELVHRNALRVLAEVGVKVEHQELRRHLTSVGGRADGGDVVRFAAAEAERYIAAAPKTPSSDAPGRVGARVGVYQSRYLEPQDNRLVRFDETRLAKYATMARELGYVERIGMLGVPFDMPGIPPAYQPLGEKLYAWKHGLEPDGSIIFTALCEPMVELYECHAASTGREFEDVFKAVGYMLSPLRLTRSECEQFMFFQQRGLRMYLGHLPSHGGSAPVTFAGALVVALAEEIFLFLVQRAFREEAPFGVGGTPGTIDMRKGLACYGRPEMQRFNVALADLASFYGCSCAGHTGLTDARLPSVEAGAQKAMGALITALACGHGSVAAGLLGMDEICSPVQLVLDGDLVESLGVILAQSNVDDEACAFEDILSAGCGGNFLGTDLTVERFRDELWEPRTWTRGSTSGWELSGRQTDADRAREWVAAFENRFVPESRIGRDEEKDLRAIIKRAVSRSLV